MSSSASTAPNTTAAEQSLSLVPSATEKYWYAAYVNTRHEKTIAAQLAQREVESFLPLCTVVNQWKDRRAKVDLPLFPGYVFVRLAITEKLKVLTFSGVIRLVGSSNGPVAIPESQIESLRTVTASASVTPNGYVGVGTRVRIIRGPLLGVQGLVVRQQSECRVIISVDLIMRSIAVEVPPADLEIL